MTDAAGETGGDVATTQTTTATAPNPLMQDGSGDAKPLTLEQIVPAEYKDKEYLSKYKSVDDFFKGVDNLQQQAGKRPFGIPQDNATQEEKDKFYLELGRPESSEGYKFEPPEKYKESMDADLLKDFSAFAHENNYTQNQYEAGVNKFLEYQEKFATDLKAKFEEAGIGQQTQWDDKFEELSAKHFGDRKEAVIDEGSQLMATYTPAEMKPYLDAIPPEALMVMAATLDGIRKDYIDEGKSPGTGGGAETGSTEQELRQELADIKAHKTPDGRYTHTNPNFKRMNDRVIEIQTQLQAIEKAAKKK